MKAYGRVIPGICFSWEQGLRGISAQHSHKKPRLDRGKTEIYCISELLYYCINRGGGGNLLLIALVGKLAQ